MHAVECHGMADVVLEVEAEAAAFIAVAASNFPSEMK